MVISIKQIVLNGRMHILRIKFAGYANESNVLIESNMGRDNVNFP